MADNVSFREIPADVLTPGQYIEIDGSRADSGTPPRTFPTTEARATGITM